MLAGLISPIEVKGEGNLLALHIPVFNVALQEQIL